MLKQMPVLAVAAVLAAAVGAGGYLALTADRRQQVEQADPDPVESMSVIAPAVTQAPVPVPPNPAAAGAQPGDVLDVDPGGLPDGLLSYELADGRHVIVDPADDLPDVVAADLAVVSGSELEKAGQERGAAGAALEALDGDAIATTGRGVVVVYFDPQAAAVDSRGEPGGWVFWARDAEGNVNYYSGPQPTPDAATADAQAWVDEHGGSTKHTIVTVSP